MENPELEAERGRRLLEESSEIVLVVDEGDRLIAASRRARETLDGLVPGQAVPEQLLKSEPWRRDQLWVNTDEHDAVVAARVLADGYTWLEEGVLDPSIEGPWIADPAPGPSTRPNLHREIRRQ